MTAEEFWRLIDTIDQAAIEACDEDAAMAPLRRALAALPEHEQFDFEERLSQCLYALDGPAHAREIGESRGSDDGFLYCRCHVVARGREHFERVLADPTLMPKTCEQWCESLLYVASEAWSEAQGRDESDWEFDASVSYETGSNLARWDTEGRHDLDDSDSDDSPDAPRRRRLFVAVLLVAAALLVWTLTQ